MFSVCNVHSYHLQQHFEIPNGLPSLESLLFDYLRGSHLHEIIYPPKKKKKVCKNYCCRHDFTSWIALKTISEDLQSPNFLEVHGGHSGKRKAAGVR